MQVLTKLVGIAEGSGELDEGVFAKKTMQVFCAGPCCGAGKLFWMRWDCSHERRHAVASGLEHPSAEL
jgi:hypothetical protein